MGLFDFFRYKKIKQTVNTDSSAIEEQHFTGVCDTPLDAKYTPENITTLGRRDIFVFGSNLAGHHVGGASRIAFDRFGAVWGQGEGLQGNSYAIPTMLGGIDTIKTYVDKFIEFAESEKTLTFYVTKIGCGIAGFKIKDIAPLFRNAYNLLNVILPVEFAVCIENCSLHPQRTFDTMEAVNEAKVKHYDTPIKIIGVGTGGSNAIGKMIENPFSLAKYAIISADVTIINTSNVSYRFHLQIQDRYTSPIPFNSKKEFELCFANQIENINLIHSILEDTVKHLIIVAGFGGGVSMYCTEWLAMVAQRAKIPVTVVCTIPFGFEGDRKQERALEEVISLKKKGVNVKILIANDIIQKCRDINFFNCFSLLDEYISETVNKLCEELSASCDEVEEIQSPVPNKLPCEITTHCYGMTRAFADIILALNEEKQYSSSDAVIADLCAYIHRFSEYGNNAAFLSVRILKCILHDDPEVFRDGVLNTDRLRELLFQDKYIHSKIDEAYNLYCNEKSEKRIHNLIILDESGSMGSIYEAALSGVNETLQTIRMAQEENKGQRHFVSLIAFDLGHYNQIYCNTPAQKAVDITKEQYRPGGCTPLYDAMGRAINELHPIVGKDDIVLVTIITDGYENASREYDGKAIKSLVERMKAEGWVFTYIGANQDVEAVAASLSINNHLAFEADEEGTDAMFKKERHSRAKFYRKVKACKCHRDLNSNYFDDDF